MTVQESQESPLMARLWATPLMFVIFFLLFSVFIPFFDMHRSDAAILSVIALAALISVGLFVWGPYLKRLVGDEGKNKVEQAARWIVEQGLTKDAADAVNAGAGWRMESGKTEILSADQLQAALSLAERRRQAEKRQKTIWLGAIIVLSFVMSALGIMGMVVIDGGLYPGFMTLFCLAAGFFFIHSYLQR